MKLSQDDQNLVKEWLQEKCNLRCFCCGYRNFTFEGVATLSIGVDVSTTRIFYSQGLPQVSISCDNCGYIMFFNPNVMGIKPKQPEEKATDTQEGKVETSTNNAE
jgi:predicted nucleic-acid-binding Zn-ribbon protein